MAKNRTVWQKHHISYNPEVVVRIRKGVHAAITLINRFKGLTEDEKRALRISIDMQTTKETEGKE